ncbi:MAG: acyltransferase domain-containing protein [Lachnospiraceae bacterium]|nr:acyltransferase domain-containing protein [Lachnospiraceae bacterium]
MISDPAVFQNLPALCRSLQFHPEVTETLCRIADEKASSCWPEELLLLTEKDSAPKAAERLAAQAAGNGRHGLDVLAVMLAAALKTHKKYRELGIPDSVFYDTMKCFPRFVEEHQAGFGFRGFDRDFWAWRQLSCVLFRLGTLEFEMRQYPSVPCQADGISLNHQTPILSVHIPSDARLTKEALDDSFRQAEAFFPKYFPDFHYQAFFCGSWLLSDKLRALLPDRSRIRFFQDYFTLIFQKDEDDAYQSFLFRRSYQNPEDFPEDTSLQRAVKAHIRNGEKIGVGHGIRKPSVLRVIE